MRFVVKPCLVTASECIVTICVHKFVTKKFKIEIIVLKWHFIVHKHNGNTKSLLALSPKPVLLKVIVEQRLQLLTQPNW